LGIDPVFDPPFDSYPFQFDTEASAASVGLHPTGHGEVLTAEFRSFPVNDGDVSAPMRVYAQTTKFGDEIAISQGGDTKLLDMQALDPVWQVLPVFPY
jgi:hypothetical protein